MLKKLFYASASILMLALAYHLGASTARAQAPGATVVGISHLVTGGGWYVPVVVTANGDIYATPDASGFSGPPFVYRGNIFGGATPAAQQTFGQLKAQYRK